MKSVPPLNGKIYDRNVNNTDNTYNRTGFVSSPPIRNRVLKCYVSEIEEK